MTQNRSQNHQKSLPKPVQNPMSFFQRFLMNCGYLEPRKTPTNLRNTYVFEGSAFFASIIILTKKPSKMTPEINQKSINKSIKKMIRKMMQFSSKNDPKVTPKGLPKSSKNRSWGHLGPQDEPPMLQDGIRDPIWTIFDRFWTDLERILDRCGTDV